MIEEIQALWQQGLSIQEIGDKLGMSRGTVSGKIHRAKLTGVQFATRKIVPKKKIIGRARRHQDQLQADADHVTAL